MSKVKIAISIQESLFDQADALAQELHISHNRLFILAVEDFIRRYKNQKLLEKVNAAYQDMPDPAEEQRLYRMRRQHRHIIENIG